MRLRVAAMVALVVGWLGLEAEPLWIAEPVTVVDLKPDCEVLFIASLTDGNITVRGEERESIELTIDRFDPEDSRRNKARLDVDLDQGLVKLKLFDQLEKSNIVAVVPTGSFLRLRAVDGDVRVDDISGEIEVNAVDGDVLLREVSGGIVANSVDGHVRVELTDRPLVNPLSLVTVDGDVLLVVERDLDANFSVSTIDGKFDCDLEYRSQGSSGGWRKFVGVNVTGTIGDGGPPISLKTIDGDVRIKARD
ncbi:DUF4097 family beta strand repeat-containing protein [Pelagicoccus enzymogenes]|nr:DUF4097 family beta strand repeat-containing protein [Pelagicoccus enzymogenes]